MRTQLLCLPGAEVLICVSVLPHESAAFVLYEAALSSLDKLPHDLEGAGLPRGVWLLPHAIPLITCDQGQLVVEAALGGQADARHAAEPLLKHPPLPAAEDDHCVPAVCAERAEALQDVLGWSGAVALEVGDVALRGPVLPVQVPLVGCQCSLVVQEEDPILRVAVTPQDFVLVQLSELLVHHDCPQLGAKADVLDSNAVLLLSPSQVRQEVLEPLHGGVLRRVEEVGLHSLLPLVLRHGHSLAARADHLAGVPRIYPQGAQEHPAAAGELADDDHTRPLPVVVVRGDELKGHEVEAGLHGGVEQYVGRAEEGEALCPVHPLDPEVDLRLLTFGTIGLLHNSDASLLVTLQESIGLSTQRVHQGGRSLPASN
mmetsp:Transcript_20824/g.65085  ORF Transcript_20824/g.65085 Transcript_20824/m.65085 type:complete len:372 (-) Transcript_20824:806-1921(-)